MNNECKCKNKKPGGIIETDSTLKYCALCGDRLLPSRCRYCLRADKIDAYDETDLLQSVNHMYAEHLRKDHCVCFLGGHMSRHYKIGEENA